MKDTVKCEICNGEFKAITGTHLSSHKMTLFSYKNKFPNAPTTSELTLSKRKVTLKLQIEKYGIEEGTKRFNEYKNKQALTNTFEYKQEKYGWSKDKFKEYNKSRSVTLENCKKRHGDEEGSKIFESYKSKQASAGCKLEYFIEKYGEEAGTDFYKNLNKRKKLTLESFIEKYGKLIGTENYKKCKENIVSNNIKLVSKPQEILIKLLLNKLPEDWIIYEGVNSKEFHRYDKIKERSWFYDLVIVNPVKICIEFNGDYWHANPIVYSPTDKINYPNNKVYMAEEIWQKDYDKINCLTRNGFDCRIVWENDFNKNQQKIIEELYEWIISKLNPSAQLKK